jgi:hypothetical protein
MPKDEKKPTGNKAIYFIAGLAVLLIGVIFLLPTQPPPPFQVSSAPSDTETATSTVAPTSTISVTDTPTRTITVTITKTPTQTLTPTSTDTSIIYASSSPPPPVVGPIITNGPPLFRVEDWISNNPKCGLTVTIFGVIVSHGIPPYTFTFWSQKEPYTLYTPVIKQITPLNNFREYVEFVPPITIVKGKHRHIVFTFQRNDGVQVSWIDDLYYPVPGDLCH